MFVTFWLVKWWDLRYLFHSIEFSSLAANKLEVAPFVAGPFRFQRQNPTTSEADTLQDRWILRLSRGRIGARN
jgi:hypothetical protein